MAGCPIRQQNPGEMAAPLPGPSDFVGRDPIPVLETIPVCIAVGTALGFLSGLGIGGGSLLLIWLTTILNTDPYIARSINLMFFLPSALVACAIRKKNRQLDLKTAIPGILSGCIFASLGYWLSTRMETAMLRKLFGLILIVTGLKEICYRPRNAR